MIDGEAEIEQHVVTDDQLFRFWNFSDHLRESDGRVQLVQLVAVALVLASFLLLSVKLKRLFLNAIKKKRITASKLFNRLDKKVGDREGRGRSFENVSSKLICPSFELCSFEITGSFLWKFTQPNLSLPNFWKNGFRRENKTNPFSKER